MRLKLKPKQRLLVTLDFAGAGKGEETRRDLSCVAQVGHNLFVGSDESVSVERLTWHAKDDAFGDHVTFDLSKLFALPAGAREEIDIEGLAFAPPYLWVTGSHSL